VLSDGIGATWFFEDLIKEYVFLRVHGIAENKWDKTTIQLEQHLKIVLISISESKAKIPLVMPLGQPIFQ